MVFAERAQGVFEALVEQSAEAGDLAEVLRLGHVLRLGDPQTAEVDRAEAVVQIHSWEIEDEWDLERKATDVVAQLFIDFNKLDGKMMLDDDAWWNRLCELLELRDDLASMNEVFTHFDSPDRFTRLIACLDSVWSEWLRSLPVLPEVTSDRLVLTRLRQGTAWWVGPARQDRG